MVKGDILCITPHWLLEATYPLSYCVLFITERTQLRGSWILTIRKIKTNAPLSSVWQAMFWPRFILDGSSTGWRCVSFPASFREDLIKKKRKRFNFTSNFQLHVSKKKKKLVHLKITLSRHFQWFDQKMAALYACLGLV